MWEVVLVHQEHSLHCLSHPNTAVLVPHPLEPSSHRGILLVQGVLRPEGVVGQGEEVYYSFIHQ